MQAILRAKVQIRDGNWVGGASSEARIHIYGSQLQPHLSVSLTLTLTLTLTLNPNITLTLTQPHPSMS